MSQEEIEELLYIAYPDWYTMKDLIKLTGLSYSAIQANLRGLEKWDKIEQRFKGNVPDTRLQGNVKEYRLKKKTVKQRTEAIIKYRSRKSSTDMIKLMKKTPTRDKAAMLTKVLGNRQNISTRQRWLTDVINVRRKLKGKPIKHKTSDHQTIKGSGMDLLVSWFERDESTEVVG